MVLHRRKRLIFVPHPPIYDEDDECWVIPASNEIFMSYDSYLERMDFYKQKRFTCEVTGRSGLSFFDAQRSEQAGSREVDQAFPDALREPILRRIQFSTTSRIDNLVDEVFDEFKADFYPGELVSVILDEATKLNGRVRDKAKFAEMKNADGSIRRKAFARYFVRLIDRPNEEALVDDDHIVRDRKVFTKQMLRSFIKNCVTREAWNGAPWLVKPRLAEEYRIDTNVPLHLQHGHKLAEKKAQRKAEQQEGMFGVWQPHKLPELKPAPKGKKQQRQISPDQASLIQQGYYEEYQKALQADPAFSAQAWSQMQPQDFHSHYQGPIPYSQTNGQYPGQQQQLAPKASPLPPPPPPPIKYPIDDMEVDPVRDGTHRPALKFATETQDPHNPDTSHIIPGLSEKTLGLLLETWNTLNVYCQVLLLDSFTFDDFIDAMQFSSEDVDCELFIEIHCAILKKLVNPENEQNGAIQISLPDLPDPSDDEEEEEEEEESRPPTPTPEPEYPAKRTRSSLNKVQFADQQVNEEEVKQEEEVDERIHRADEMFGEYGWVQRLRKRDFRKGGWELVVVGLLHQLSGRPRLTDICNKILIHLAPLDAEPTIQTVKLQYSTMDINLRVEALQIICHLFLETKTVKNFLEEMSNTMTQYRKVKIEHQRARKDAIAKLKNLHIERRLLAPEPEKSPTPVPELEETALTDKIDDGETSIADTEDEAPVVTRSLRHGNDRAAERKRKREEEQERKEKAAEAKQNKGSKEYQKVLKQIDKERERIEEAEEQIMTVDNDLREADCPRTRVLGKDRFCNRYWWFERNAMPHGGLPESSTADAEYANGRIWVQGPDDMEREGFIDVPEQDQVSYFHRFQMTPRERRRLEEGTTSVEHAGQWGFYDDPQDVDMLIGWLESRGIRELKLKKELTLQRDVIVKHMENRKAYLAPRPASEEPTTRMSTRTKTYVTDSNHRCLKWRNNMAMDEQGHRHVDPPPQKKGKSRKPTAPEPMTTRKAAAEAPAVLNRQGKPVTRQGSRYNF